MWGTEYSGPEAAVRGAFKDRSCVICEKKRVIRMPLVLLKIFINSWYAHCLYDAEQHDIHAAYVSHISHITSFALANTVLEKKRKMMLFFELSGGGLKVPFVWQKQPCHVGAYFYGKKENVLDV